MQTEDLTVCTREDEVSHCRHLMEAWRPLLTLRKRALQAMLEARKHGGNSVWFSPGASVEA